MAATKPTVKATGSTELVKQITYLASALKAPRITEAASRLADQARDAGWTHEDYLAAVLEREVSARNASGARIRIRAAGFPGVKTLAGVDTSVIALWLGHAGGRSTDAYVHADITIKEKALALTTPATARPGRYRPPDKILAFLESL